MAIKLITLFAFLIWSAYWKIEEHRAYKEKPKAATQSLVNTIGQYGIHGLYLFVALQLLGFSAFPIPGNIFGFQVVGILVVLTGLLISILARITISNNWSNGYEYQIKKNQELVEQGVYAYIRHPIYTGITFCLIGAELIVGSWLWVSFLALFIPAYLQGKREERILLAHFGEKYKTYMKKSKMLIPFLF